jgi:exopolysaccharide biosynthesis polyprenyl glycosylphosphotransferase
MRRSTTALTGPVAAGSATAASPVAQRSRHRPAVSAASARPALAAHGGEKAGWYLPAALAADAAGSATAVLVTFTVTGQPHPAAAAATAAAVWLGVQTGHQRYGRRSLGESRGLLSTLHDWLTLLGLLAVLRIAAGEASAPGVALLALAPIPLLTGACRALTHRHLRRQHRAAQTVRRALVVGEPGPLDHVVEQLAARTDHAYVVTGTVPVGPGPLRCGAPCGDRLAVEAADDGALVLAAARRFGAETVLVVPGSALTGERLRRLSWAVQDAGLPLAVASGLTEVALRRLRVATAAGLNLLHVTPPLRRGAQSALKSVLDRLGAAVGLVLLAPLFALLALAVRLDSPGPALYRQTRVGRDGVPFTMWKFRSMVPDADGLRAGLEAADEQDGPMFKIRRDPRVTRLGALLRRTSLDELPQLLNVLCGQMSLVGPRPPLPEEVAAYDAVARRRLDVRPGMTGPWQVGGRSELSWDESLAIDLRYTDNWSLTGDLDVLARTVRAVVDGRGAY